MTCEANRRWSPLELDGLVEDEESHVCFKRTIKHLALHPYHLNNVKKALNNILDGSRNTYDKDLEGFVLDFKKPKLLSNLGHTFYDSPFIHVDIEADFYVFQLTVGAILKGIVNKKCRDHVIMLVHKMFTVSILKPYNAEEWLGDLVEVGQQIKCHLTEMNKWSKPPIIIGTLQSDYLEGCRLSESIIAANLLHDVSDINAINGNVTDVTNSEEKLTHKKPFNNASLNGHVQKSNSTKATKNVKTDSASTIKTEENTSSDTNVSSHEKKTKKRAKYNNLDLASTFKVKEEKEWDVSGTNDTSSEERRVLKKNLQILKIKDERNSDTNDDPWNEKKEKRYKNHNVIIKIEKAESMNDKERKLSKKRPRTSSTCDVGPNIKIKKEKLL